MRGGSWRRLEELSIPPKVLEALEKLVESLKSRLREVEVYLFGSFARGDWLEGSDVDIIVVSPNLRGMAPEKRYRLIRLLADPSIPIEILAYTPEEFQELKKRSVVLRDASKYWVKLA